MSKHDDISNDIHDDIDFAMLNLPSRPGPCKADKAIETDPVEKRLEREGDRPQDVGAQFVTPPHCTSDPLRDQRDLVPLAPSQGHIACK